MCGIVGFIDRMNQNDKSKTLEEMMNTIVHRGPSSSGEFIDEGAAIGFRRLSIIDLEGGSGFGWGHTRSHVSAAGVTFLMPN